ncbi:transcriptional regulator, GntR family [Ancylobacter novellus DSM 506]|uniref:Transcriptional regulator, GntR family n=1 Tax=Ancylobacter novellus (strain ATCC 8093 / DSM 506 / JCM 20403 / CCM 1077 / IAM 12100 / NBRC 12443 / NCIMB 10456) TaxID=639283 RepID=D7A2K9_ANCN5|nr:transcriptional regulator, GntR family [Ancylobacter novellus DSM 506]
MTEQSDIPRKRGRPRKLRPADAAGAERLPRAGLHERAARQLRSMIVAGKLPGGAPIVEAELCEALGISRTPLREAVKMLAAHGLVELRPNRSARVAPMDASHVTDLFEALGNVERIAAEYAALRLTATELLSLRQMQETMERHYGEGDLAAYFAVNQAIHSAILAGAHNATFVEMHRWLFTRAERARYFALGRHSRWVESIQEHRDILAALEARDGYLAGRLLAAHVLHTGTNVLAMLASGGGVDAAA